ncbi:MAG: outer membrane protein assembly factor BamD [Dysgonamonadaceae bacterium]|jgi:outer membrane protein assembly factor BamD|nr:outer membrane protein assembly factor BamD [Dysgonamonadaceae bacterium]
MKSKIAGVFLLSILLLSCGEYNKVLKLTDIDRKFEYAKKYFDDGKFNRSAALLEEVVQIRRGSSIGEEALYLLARSHYEMKDYFTASEHFASCYKTYPKGKYAELARYYSAYGLFLESPDPRLDQTQTYKAMEQFQDFIELYPQSQWKEDAQRALFELQEKLALKELLSVRLYYNLGDYLIYSFSGGNYLSCVITAQNAMRAYPFTQYREEFMYYTFKSKYEMAMQSVSEKKDFRYRDVADEYYSYVNEFPEGKYEKEIKRLYRNVEKELKHIN